MKVMKTLKWLKVHTCKHIAHEMEIYLWSDNDFSEKKPIFLKRFWGRGTFCA